MTILQRVRRFVKAGCTLCIDWNEKNLRGSISIIDTECQVVDSFTITNDEFTVLSPITNILAVTSA